MDKNSSKKEIIMYLVFGVLTTAVSWSSYTLFVNVFGMKVSFANAISWVLAVSFAFVTNKLWVFNSKTWAFTKVVKELLSFVASRGITGVFEILSVPFLEKLGFDKTFFSLAQKIGLSNGLFFTKGIYSKIFVSVVVIVLNYFFSKIFVFRNKGKNDEK